MSAQQKTYPRRSCCINPGEKDNATSNGSASVSKEANNSDRHTSRQTPQWQAPSGKAAHSGTSNNRKDMDAARARHAKRMEMPSVFKDPSVPINIKHPQTKRNEAGASRATAGTRARASTGTGAGAGGDTTASSAPTKHQAAAPGQDIYTASVESLREDITAKVVKELTPLMHKAAAETAEEHMKKFFEYAKQETTEEKLKVILSRMEGLDDDGLDTLFFRSPVMLQAIKKVLQRAELDEAVGEWEDIVTGFKRLKLS